MAHIVGLRPGADLPLAETLAAGLVQQGIIVSVRVGALRVSLHVYSTPNDVDTLLAALRASLAQT